MKLFSKYLAIILILVGVMMFQHDKIYADSSDTNYNSGVVALYAKNYDQAIAYFQAALKNNPTYIQAYNNLALALQGKGDINNAILAYQQTLMLDPLYGKAYYNLGLCLKNTGNVSDAIESLQTFINFNPNDSEAVRAKWIASELRDKIKNQDEKTRKYYLGCWLLSDMNYEDAVAPLQAALALDPNDIKIKYALALAYKGKGDYQAAIEQLNAIIQQNNKNALAYYLMGECYEQMGNMQGAAQAWQVFASIAPYAPSTQALQGRFANIQQQLQASQQKQFLENQLNKNNPANPLPAPDQGQAQPEPQSQTNPLQPQKINLKLDLTYQYAQTYNQPAGQQNNQPGGLIPGITAPPNYVNQLPQNNNVVPQFNPGQYNTNTPQFNTPSFGTPMTSYGAGFGGPAPGTPAARTGKTRVAVIDFDFSSVRPWWSGNWDIGKGVSSLLTGQIVRSGTYSVVERSALDQVLQEQKFSNSSNFDPTTAAKLGKLLGVDVLVMGTISQFGVETKGGGFGAAIPIISSMGKFSANSATAIVTFDMRIVDVDTAEILDVVTVTGKSKRRGFSLDFSKNLTGGGIDFGSSNFQDSTLGEASIAAAQRATEILNNQYEKLTRATVDTTSQNIGVVAYVGAQGIIINAGSGTGIKVGNKLSVERLSDVVRDPISGNIIKAITAPIGDLEITEVETASSTGRMLSGATPQVGDIVKYRRDMNIIVPATGAQTSVTSEILYKKPKKEKK